MESVCVCERLSDFTVFLSFLPNLSVCVMSLCVSPFICVFSLPLRYSQLSTLFSLTF